MRGYAALAAGVVCVAFASAASATDLSGPAPINPDRFYVSFHGGYVFSSTSHDTAVDTDPNTGTPPLGPTFVGDSISKPGYRVGAAVGRTWDYFSLEGEIGYFSADVDHVHLISTDGAPTPLDVPATGSGSTLTAMVNGFIGTNIGSIRPYVGAGVGVGVFAANDINSPPASIEPDPAERTILNGTTTGLAAQFLAGVDFAIGENTMLGGRYRYLFVNSLSLMDGGYKHDFSINSQSVEIVLTQKLN